MSKTCYTPVKGLDDVIASKVTGWNKYLVANLRGLYQERTGDPLNLTVISSDTRINVYAGANENADLSNFANRPFIMSVNPDGTKSIDVTFKSVEHYFQAEKAYFAGDLETASKIEEASNASQAKVLGRQIRNLDSKEWDKVSSEIMEKGIKASFEQNPNAMQRLLSTGNAVLTHTQDKSKWGTEFPRILMSVRKKLGGSVTIDEAVRTLIEFRRSLSKEDANRLLDSINNPAVSYRQLRDEFSAEERFNRISMISTMFSDVVDAIQEENPLLSRSQIIAGFDVEGQRVGGVAGIFNEIYDTLQEQYSTAIEENDTDTAAKYQKVFDNWGALLSFAKIRIKDAEDIKIGQNINFADSSNPNNFNENDMTEKFIMEESKREGWMDQSEFQSSFGSIGKQVRKVIGRTPIYKDSEPVLDDLGFPVMQNPIKVHQELLDIARGISSETELLQALREYSSTVSWIRPLLEELENPVVRTQFFTDFKKNFQPYSIQTESTDGRLKKYKTVLLNRIKGDRPFGSFMTSVKMGKIVNPVNSIYESTGRVMPVRVERLRQDIIETLGQDSKNVTKKPKFWSMTRGERKVFLINATESLGLDIDGDTLDRIMSRNADLRALNKELLDTANFGLNLTNEEKSGKTEVKYADLIKRASSNEKKGVLREKITKMLAVVTKNREGLQLESRVRYGDNTFFSNVIPSFLGDRMDKIASFVKNGDITGLKRTLENTYLNSSYFSYDGKILNKWIEELYNSDLSKDNNFASNFTYKRFLGTDKLKFEDFTSKQHLVQMMNEYFSEKQINAKSEYAWYPTFILGDSGVSKFIKAKRYSAQEILDGLYNVYIQEKRRMELTKAVNKKLEEDGYKKIDNYSSKSNQFTLLPFLNEERYSSMISETNLEQSVKRAIRTYMEKAVAEFSEKASSLGVLDQSNGEYVYLSQEAKNTPVEKLLADYYWNSKFATIQQLQMMTIDPSFYKNTKDLQKRYKEIHAPGSALSAEAIDPWTGERYSMDGIERVVYFDDIDINAEDVDQDFMNAIANHFGKDSDVYKAYKANTLTDGQGYRTLESYRKVMGMAGKWDENMQQAYEQIQSIRARIAKDENPSAEDIKALSDLAVTFQPIKPYLYGFENYSVGTDVQKIAVQHKYAEAVLIPELLPAGSKLRDIAYWMENHVNPDTGRVEPIDMIGSTKIVKVGGFGSTDISKVDRSNITEALNRGYVHQLNYGDYRIQTNVPEHINSSQLFGTQVRKLIMAKVSKFKDYSGYVSGNTVNLGGRYGKVKLNGGNLVRFYNALVCANIVESYDMFKNAVSDRSKISERLIQTTANNARESKDNMLAYSMTGDSFTIPLFEGALEHDSSALLFSLFKKMVNKQSIKGGSAVQVSAMGITGYAEDGDLRYVTDPNNPNNILYAECEMPFDISYTDVDGREVSLEFNDWCNEDGTLKLDSNGKPLIEKAYPNVLSLLAYRIPTERDYSMINLRIKRFSHKMAGGTIKVPPQGTTIAGFDFDIDKLYMMRNEFKYSKKMTKEQLNKAWKDYYAENPELLRELIDLRKADEGAGNLISQLIGVESSEKEALYNYKEGVKEDFDQWLSSRRHKYSSLEEYDFSKSPLENSKASRNNMLIQLIQQRLSDEETFEDRYTPGGFGNASKAARLMRELRFGDTIKNGNVDLNAIKESISRGESKDPEPNYDPSDPMTIVVYNQQNQVAGKLIGVFANQNTNHAFASLMEEFSLNVPVSFAGKTYSDLLHNDDIDTSLTVAELLAASVDAVKDPVLNFLNLNTITADAGGMLARLGYTTEDIGLLFNQPIIMDICEYSFNTGMTDIDSVIDAILDVYKTDIDSNKVPDVDYGKERLAYNIAYSNSAKKEEWMKNGEFVAKQRNIAELFRNILTISDEVSQFVRNTKFTASNAVGSTFGDLYSQQMKVNKYVNGLDSGKSLVHIKVAEGVKTPLTIDNELDADNQSYLESLIENPLAYEQAMFDMNRKANRLLNENYPYNAKAYVDARSTLASLTKSNILDADTINSIHSDLMVYMLSQQENSLFNGNMPVTVDGKQVSARQYFSEIFPRELFSMLESNPNLKSLPIFTYMQFDSTEDGKVSMNIQDIGGLAPYQKDEIKESWADLLKNEETAEIANSLFLYNYYKLGFNFSPLSFMNLTPTEVKLGIQVGVNYNGEPQTYVSFLREVQAGRIGVDSNEFAKQYILNHTDNTRLVYTPKGNIKKAIERLVYNNGVVVDEFSLDLNKIGKKDAGAFLLPSKDKGINKFRPAIIIDDQVYMASGSGFEFNTSTTGSMTYTRVDALGVSGRSLQYNNSNPVDIKVVAETEGNTSVEPEITETADVRTTEELIKEAYDLVMQADKSLESESVVQALREASREDLIDTIEALKAEANQLRDQQGNKIC